MTTIYSFLFFLQKQTLYFNYQDQILDILASSPQLSVAELKVQIQMLSPILVNQTCLMESVEPNPFPNRQFQRIKYGDLDYPIEFTHLIDPPLVISVFGDKNWQKEKIAIVGSRRPSQKSLWWHSKELRSLLLQNNYVSVSGGAIGIDQIVHQGSYDLKLPTIVILPSGLNNIYPRSLALITKKILDAGGCLLSEFSDEQAVRKYHFSYRNRLIAAMGKISIIIEAREKSGSLITAHRALEMGKDVFVVPSHPLDESFKGSLQLLKLGAHMITKSEDIDYWS